MRVEDSPMSKVQSPKSNSQAERPRLVSADTRDKEKDSGYSSLEAGLRVSDLRKSFSAPSGEKIEVIRGLSFAANRGETVAIMGASGAGKSTLLHLLGGLEAGDNGSISLDAFAVDRAGRGALAGFRNRNIGFIFQFHYLLLDLTAVENVSLPLLITRTNPREATERALKMLEDVGLGSRSAHKVGLLSGGEQQRVAVCRALICRPLLVLADEPTGNLDTEIGEEIGRSLVSYARNGNAIVVLATHNQDVAELCDRVLILRDGLLADVSLPKAKPALK